MHVLVSGAGIAGLTLAHCLHRAGIECTVVEKSSSVRPEGYMIDFFGSGYDVAERLGMLPDLERIHYPIDRLVFLTSSGREKYSIRYTQVRRLFDGRHFNFLRGDLEQVLYSKVPGRVDVRFGVVVESVRQNAAGIEVRLSDRTVTRADIVVGADGVHSNVRRLCFGTETAFTRYLYCNTAAFIIDRLPHSLAGACSFATLAVPDRQVSIYRIRGGRLATFFVHRSPRPPGPSPADAVREMYVMYEGMNWIVPELLSRVPTDLYFDDVSQIVVPAWVCGRVVLVGDAAYCVSLLAGQGASLAMAGAFILAEEISAGGRDVTRSLERYQQRVKPFVEKKQVAGRKMADWFLPHSALRLAIRDTVMRFSGLPVARLLVTLAVAPEGIFAREARVT